jgi:hypothetical protein
MSAPDSIFHTSVSVARSMKPGTPKSIPTVELSNATVIISANDVAAKNEEVSVSTTLLELLSQNVQSVINPASNFASDPIVMDYMAASDVSALDTADDAIVPPIEMNDKTDI